MDLLVLLALLALSALLGLSALSRRPDLYRGAADVLFSDAGYNLLVVQRLLDGGRLYADIAFQYGPLPPLIHTAAAAVFGNTLSVFHSLLLIVTLVNVALAYFLVRRSASMVTAAVVVGLGLTANLLIPGSLLGSFSNASYMPFERTLILLAALVWCAPGQRSRDRAILLGVVIGSWQTVRFGGGVFLGVAVVLADLLSLWWTDRLAGREFGRWLRSIAITVGAAVLVELLLVAVAFVLLPREVAIDFAWPLYVLDTYDAWVTPDLRWPHWGGVRVLIAQYLTPLVGAACGLFALAWYLGSAGSRTKQRPFTDADQIRLLIPFLFYLISAVGFFRMAFHFFQFAWALVIPAAWLMERGSRVTRLAIPVLLLPCFLLSARAQLASSPDPGQREFVTPSGEALWGSPEAVAELNEMVRRVSPPAATAASATARPAILVLPLGAGFHHAYSIPSLARQPWFMNGFPRPYDEAPLLESLDRTSHVVLRAPGPNMRPEDPCSWYEPFPLSPATCRAMAERLGPPDQVGEYWIFPVR